MHTSYAITSQSITAKYMFNGRAKKMRWKMTARELLTHHAFQVSDLMRVLSDRRKNNGTLL